MQLVIMLIKIKTSRRWICYGQFNWDGLQSSIGGLRRYAMEATCLPLYYYYDATAQHKVAQRTLAGLRQGTKMSERGVVV